MNKLNLHGSGLRLVLEQKIVPTSRIKVPTGRVKVPAGRYVVPTGKDKFIVSAGRTKVIPAGSTILVLVVLCLLRVDSKVLYNLNRRKDLSRAGPTEILHVKWLYTTIAP
ncbi:hypothetical protein Tco_0832545 [Tanacetum coccineum]